MAVTSEVDSLCVVLVGTRNPLNIGAAARAMSNFGLRRLRVVNPYEVAFREARSAVDAAKLLASAEEYKSVGEAVADCTLVVGTTAVRNRQLQHPIRRLECGARLIRKHLGAGRVALVFGSEKRGLTNADFSHCHWLMRIPTAKEYPSMNLGQAVAICLYELVRDTKAVEPPEELRPATSAQVERITAMLFEALCASGYVKPGAAVSTNEKLRRQVRRLHLQADDAELWLGRLRTIAGKLRLGRL